jgi:hypothetical protein
MYPCHLNPNLIDFFDCVANNIQRVGDQITGDLNEIRVAEGNVKKDLKGKSRNNLI